MRISNNSLVVDEIDLKEVFALFTSVSRQELRQLDDPDSDHYFPNVDLAAEYELSLEKREFAIDALRAAFAFLERHGYRLRRKGQFLTCSRWVSFCVDVLAAAQIQQTLGADSPVSILYS